METVLHTAVHTTRKDKMIKKFLFLALFIIAGNNIIAIENYISPESYAVNEADLTDYRYIPPSPKINLEYLENLENQTVKNISEDVVNDKNSKTKKVKKEKSNKVPKIEDPEAYKRKLSYKVAKWWVDKRYEREEAHHGTKHEIKIKAREEYEKKLEEKLNKENNSI